MTYEDFIDRKTHFGESSGFEPLFMADDAFEFQQALITWACLKGRAAIMADCGLGKSLMELTWAENVARKTNKPVLLLTPLAVGAQTVREGEKFGIEAKQSRDGQVKAKITVTNYQQLHKFNWQEFGGVVCDESSILKNFDGQIKAQVTDFMRKLPYRLLATATPAPNDYIELGTSSEALGNLGFADMVNRFFKKAEKTTTRSEEFRAGNYRFRGHGERDFWRWVCSWARAVRKPSDLGFSDEGYTLPPMKIREHVIRAKTANPDFLFDMPAVGLQEQRAERRRTIQERCEQSAALVEGHDTSLLWCHLNDEGDALEDIVPNSRQISGRTSDDEQEEIIEWFTQGSGERRLIGKPQQIGFGLNFQHCAHQTFFPSHSFEQWYQATRRSWRFGQERTVEVDVVSSEGEAGVVKNLTRKADQTEQMFATLVTLINAELSIQRENPFTNQLIQPQWL